MIIQWFRQKHRAFILKHYPIDNSLWQQQMNAPLFYGLSHDEQNRLRELTTVFLYRKYLNGVQGMQLSEAVAVAVASQACLLVLDLGLEYYNGWVEVIIYPGAFRVERDVMDASGLISHENHMLGGESWLRGPVILAWDSAQSSHAGDNVVIHEFAHKLDMLNGAPNGMPPLNRGMDRRAWTDAFSTAFARLNDMLDQHQTDTINPYAAESPAEFFAVCSEYFFTAPQQLLAQFPDVYRQLSLFYRQDPGQRLYK